MKETNIVSSLALAVFLRRVVLLGLFALAPGAATGETAAPLVFAPLPMEAPETVVKQWKPLLEHLGKTLGAPIRIEHSRDYAEILEKFRAGRLDLAYLGPLPYVTLKARFPAATPLLHFNEKNGEPTYTCVLVALGERKLAVNDLRGKKIALTQPLSTCGPLATDALLRRAGGSLEKNHYRYLDQHDAVAIAVARGDYDAGGLKSAIAAKYAHLGLLVIAESPPLPSFALIANGERLSAASIERIRAALLGADAGQRAAWGDNIRHGVVAASDQDYDAVRRLRGRADIPEKGNF